MNDGILIRSQSDVKRRNTSGPHSSRRGVRARIAWWNASPLRSEKRAIDLLVPRSHRG